MSALNKCKLIFKCYVITLLATSLLSPRYCLAEPSLSFATVDSPPLSSNTIPNGGVFTELTRAAFQQVGYDFKLTYVPWKRALLNTKNGHYDGLLLTSYAEDRVEYLNYSKLVMVESVVLISRRDLDIEFSTYKDLELYTIGAMRASIAALLLAENNVKTEETTDLVTSLRMVVHGRLDLMAINKLTLNHLLSNEYSDWQNKLKIVAPLYMDKLYLTISRKNPDHEVIVKAFNQGLLAIQRNGTYDDILNKYQLKKEQSN